MPRGKLLCFSSTPLPRCGGQPAPRRRRTPARDKSGAGRSAEDGRAYPCELSVPSASFRRRHAVPSFPTPGIPGPATYRAPRVCTGARCSPPSRDGPTPGNHLESETHGYAPERTERPARKKKDLRWKRHTRAVPGPCVAGKHGTRGIAVKQLAGRAGRNVTGDRATRGTMTRPI